MKEITFITGNAKKAKQLGRYLDFPVEHVKVDLLEIQSLDLEEIVRHKVLEAYKKVGKPVLVEDTSLTFLALGKLPGPLIKWFLTELGNQGLCDLLKTHKNRKAIARVNFAFYDGKDLKIFSGEMKGVITEKPVDGESFGWNPIFIPAGYDKTWDQMNPEDQNKTSMRKIALKKLEDYLKNG